MIGSWQGYDLDHFDHYRTKWVWPKSVDLTKGGIPLTVGDSFSRALQELLGPGNTTYIHGLEGALLVDGFEALMEREANARYRNSNKAEAIAMFTKLKMLRFCEPAGDGELCWQICGKEKKNGGWVDLSQDVFILPHTDALATLARMVGTSVENIQRQTSKRNLSAAGRNRRLFEDIPEVIKLPRRPVGRRYAELVYRKDIYTHAQELLGAILKYNLAGQTVCLPAAVLKDRLCIGMVPPPACLMNQDLIDSHPGSAVLLFGDVRSALAMEKFLGEVLGYDPRNFIVSAHFGDNLDVLPWNYLRGHDVVVIPAASKVDMSRVKLYKDYVTGAMANSFRVFPGFLLHSPPGVELKQAKKNLPSLQAALLRDSMFIDHMKMPLTGAQQIIEKSVSYEEYKAWGQLGGIFKRAKNSVATVSSSALQALPPPDPTEIPPTPKKLEDVVLHHFIRPGSNVLVLGAKNAGKTQFTLSVCQALCKRGILCSRFHNEANVPCKVAYVDAETPLDEFQANLKHYELDNDDGFCGLSISDQNTQKLFPDFSLMSQEFQDNLQNYLLENKCRYVVLDNLTALMGDEVNYGASANKVIEFVKQLQNNGMCVIIVHHLTTSGNGSQHAKASGSDIFIRMARAIIELKSKTEILDGSTTSATVKKSALQAGLTVGIRFKTCKAAPVLEDKTYYVHLPFGEAHWEPLGAYGLDGQVIELPTTKESLLPDKNNSAPPAKGSLHDTLKDLSPDQRQVVEVLQAGAAKRVDIQTKLRWGEGKTQNVLNDLVKMGLITRQGASSSTNYVLKCGE